MSVKVGVCGIVTLCTVIALAGTSLCAFAEVPKFKKLGSDDLSVQNYLIGLDDLKKADWDGAIDALQKSIRFAYGGYAPVSFYWLGVAYEAKHQDLKAIEAAKKYLEQAQGNTDNGHLLLAELYLRNDRLDEAEAECKMVINTSERPKECERANDWLRKCLLSRAKRRNPANDQDLSLPEGQSLGASPSSSSHEEINDFIHGKSKTLRGYDAERNF